MTAARIAPGLAPCSGWFLADLPMSPAPSLHPAAGSSPASRPFARRSLAPLAPLLLLPWLVWALPASLAEPSAPRRAGTSPAIPASSSPATGPAITPESPLPCERLWGDGHSFQSLDFVQVVPIRLKRSRYDLLIRPDDHVLPLSALSLRLPDNFDGSLIFESLRLCRMLTPPAVHRTRCSEPLPARVERPSVQEVRIIPETPLAGTDTYGLSLMLFNPSVPGRYPLRMYAASPAAPQPTYRGTWLIRISAEQD